jgi:hypothetical protein
MEKFLNNYRTFLSNWGNYYVVVPLNILIVIKQRCVFVLTVKTGMALTGGQDERLGK